MSGSWGITGPYKGSHSGGFAGCLEQCPAATVYAERASTHLRQEGVQMRRAAQPSAGQLRRGFPAGAQSLAAVCSVPSNQERDGQNGGGRWPSHGCTARQQKGGHPAAGEKRPALAGSECFCQTVKEEAVLIRYGNSWKCKRYRYVLRKMLRNIVVEALIFAHFIPSRKTMSQCLDMVTFWSKLCLQSNFFPEPCTRLVQVPVRYTIKFFFVRHTIAVFLTFSNKYLHLFRSFIDGIYPEIVQSTKFLKLPWSLRIHNRRKICPQVQNFARYWTFCYSKLNRGFFRSFCSSL